MKLQGRSSRSSRPTRRAKSTSPRCGDWSSSTSRTEPTGICPVATTGEGPVLTHDERANIIKAVVETARGKALVFPGTGTYNTRESIEQTEMAKELGADGALIVTPYYNKPTQEGLYRHYKAIAEAVPLPIMLYNVPSRTGVSMAPETTARLGLIKNIVALKDASGNVEQVTQLRALSDIQILSGEDSLTLRDPLPGRRRRGVGRGERHSPGRSPT
jgi:4-hydroxy-tetrahydrodipicolinate synthase